MLWRHRLRTLGTLLAGGGLLAAGLILAMRGGEPAVLDDVPPRPRSPEQPAQIPVAQATTALRTVASIAVTEPSDPFNRLQTLTSQDCERLRPHAAKAVVMWESAVHRMAGGSQRRFDELHVQEQIARHRAVQREVEAGRAYRDDHSFGTAEARWFEERGAEMYRIHAGGIWGIALLQFGAYPDLERAIQAHRRAKQEHLEKIEAIHRGLQAQPHPPEGSQAK